MVVKDQSLLTETHPFKKVATNSLTTRSFIATSIPYCNVWETMRPEYLHCQ